MDLPRKWPGRVKVRQALTLMRLLGKWESWTDEYAKSSKRHQKTRYWLFRETYYWVMYGTDPDHPKVKRIGR